MHNFFATVSRYISVNIPSIFAPTMNPQVQFRTQTVPHPTDTQHSNITLHWIGLDSTLQTPLGVIIFSLPLCVSLPILFPLILWLIFPLLLSFSVCLHVSLPIWGSSPGSIFTHASLNVHLEQLLSRLLQPQIDRDRAVWARPAFCCFPNVSVWTAARWRMDSGAWVSECVCVCMYVCVCVCGPGNSPT